ncbi:MAG: substrate-binding domain-containing protein [Chloroflexota bacterium]
MEIVFNRTSNAPAYQQITDSVRRQVALGQVKPGERLPAIRDLAQQLGLDPGTVARAYQELERDGTITARGRSGSFIAETRERGRSARDRLATAVDRAILEGLGLGFATEDIETAFATRLAGWRERRRQQVKRQPAPVRTDLLRFSGSHDLAVELLVTHMKSLYPGVHLNTSFIGSLAGLVAMECGEADIAGAHLLDEESGHFNTPFIRRLMPSETVAVMNLTQRVQGLILAPGNPKQLISLADLKWPDVSFVNRQKGSGTRIYLDSQLLRLGISPNQIKGFQHEETTHVGVAAAVAEGKADAGIGTQSAAASAGLDFIPLMKERYDLMCLKDNFDRSPLAWLAVTVRSRDFKAMLNSMPGYDTSDTGEVRFVGPPSHQTEAVSAS